ncbi:MAG TPA: hypothetical protein VGD37_19260 [Kofleriaceae bacterium]
MRITALVVLASTACVPRDSDCFDDSPELVRDPRTGSCIEVGDTAALDFDHCADEPAR